MRRAPFAALLASVLALGACGPVNRGLESINQPVVSRTDYTFDVPADKLLASDGAQRLDAWFAALRLGYGDSIAIDDPSSYDHRAVRDAVAQVLARHGLLLSDRTPVTAGLIETGDIRVVVSRANAHVPGCPDWSRPSQPEFAASGMSNYGCAVNTNLAAMVANPQDLIQGQAASDSDPRAIARAVKAYRETPAAASNAVKVESTKNGGN